MKHSKAHQHFADLLNNPRALDHPEEFLGENWKDVLNFWLFLDTLSEEQWKTVNERYVFAENSAAFGDAGAAVGMVVTSSVAVKVWHTSCGVVGYATYELIGSHILISQNKPLIFLPLFLDL